MRKRLVALAAAAFVGSVLLTGCAKKTETTTTETEKTTDTGGTYASTPATTPMMETTPGSMGGTMETTPGGAPRTTTPSP